MGLFESTEFCDVSKSLTAQPGQRVLHQRPVASALSAGGSAQSLWAGAGDQGGCGGCDGGGDGLGGEGGGGGGEGGGATWLVSALATVTHP